MILVADEKDEYRKKIKTETDTFACIAMHIMVTEKHQQKTSRENEQTNVIEHCNERLVG